MKYHPCSKEFQEETKRLKLTGNQLMQKYIEEGKLPNPTDVDRRSNNAIYERAGYDDKNHYLREWRYANEIQQPMSDNKQCSHYLGTVVAERAYGRIILPEMFGDIEKEMPYGNPGYDFIVKGDIKIDIKSCCLRQDKNWKGWEPHVRSNVADHFVILMFDNRTDLNIVHVLLIGRDNMVRGYEFYKRESIKITNTHRGMLEFKRYEWTDKLKSLKDQSNIKNIQVVLKREIRIGVQKRVLTPTPTPHSSHYLEWSMENP